MNFAVDNIIWYRVKLEDGTQGYVASNFISLVEEIPEGETYKIEGEYIYTVPGAKLEQIEGATSTSAVFGTGASLTLNETEYALIMLGDANGDGAINSGDLLKIQKHLLQVTLLDSLSSKSADVNQDGNINSGDLLKIQKHLLNVSKINL